MNEMINTTSFKKIKTSWNDLHNKPNIELLNCGHISTGLAKRLTRYATEKMAHAGFGAILKACNIEVTTTDGDLPPSERVYHVSFTTPQGGQLSVIGILTRRGWPLLDHGFDIDHPN